MFKDKINFFKTFHKFIVERKLMYMYPIFFTLLLILWIIIIAEIPWVWPFIYTIF